MLNLLKIYDTSKINNIRSFERKYNRTEVIVIRYIVSTFINRNMLINFLQLKL
ncbi:MAG: hypothetical protein ACTS44_01410 [Candidatus Hodgkinia cicadicola]